MCGIAGFGNSTAERADPDVIRRMAAVLHHRGPDDEGFFFDGSLALGFKRLSIVDLGGGHQPMTSADRRYTIVFNGEIYNHGELRERLVRECGARFQTQSDTEVLLAAYQHWGAEALPRLNGMFACAIWDAAERTLFLARDRLGKKPLYFVDSAHGFVFASEVKALLAHPAVSAAVEPSRIAAFLAYRYVPGDETLFRGVRCLPPGSWMTWSARGASAPRAYWTGPAAAAGAPPVPAASEHELRERFGALLTDAVRLRRMADVPVGAFLSGGLDSSVIVALLSSIHHEPLKTFSVGFDAGVDETRYARLVAERFHTDHHEIRVGAGELIANIPRVLHARETPITEASDIPIYLLSRLARTKVTVVLSGEGSDEILAGYPKYAFEKTFGAALRLAPRGLLSAAGAALPFGLRRAQLALECASQANRFERYAHWFGAFAPDERTALLSPELNAADGVHAASEAVARQHEAASPVDEMLRLDTRLWLPGNLLLRGDRMTMAHSLELRCPFLDYRLVEMAERDLPLALKIHGRDGKRILKDFARPLLPPEILERRKWGFKVPLDEWFRGPLAGPLRDVLLSPRALGRGYFREPRLRQLIDAHVSGRVNYEKQLWILFQLELWHLMFVDGALSPSDSLV